MSVAVDRSADRTPGVSLEQVEGLNVLNVAGSFYDMGHQHGRLLKEQVPTGPLAYYRTYVEKFLGRSIAGPAAPYVWPVLSKVLGKQIAEKLPDFARETLRGLADGAGLPYQTLLDGATMPDGLLWLMARGMQVGRPGAAVQHRINLGLGCTSVIAWGDATSDGKLYHARNFDYHGVESWPRTATVIFHRPAEGMAYVSNGAAGIPLGGVTAMNEAGLTLTVHQHMFTDRARLGGMPIGLVGDEVMRKAETLDDAEKILGAHTPIGCWTYVIADGRKKEVLCWEEDPKHRAKRRIREPQRFAYANIYLDPELGETEVNLYPSYWRHNENRYRRANALLEEGHGSLDVEGMAAILGDTGGRDCRISGSIAMLMTVGSVVFQPEDGIVWIASGQSPTSHGRFIPFDLATGARSSSLSPVDGSKSRSTAELEAFESYRQAYIAYVDEDDPPRSTRLMRKACELCPEQPLYWSLLGMLSMKHGPSDEARQSFDRALSLGHPDEERIATFHLWHGRALDLGGRRDDATRAYHAALSKKIDPAVRRAAERSLRSRYRARQAANIHIDFTFADVAMP